MQFSDLRFLADEIYSASLSVQSRQGAAPRDAAGAPAPGSVADVAPGG